MVQVKIEVGERELHLPGKWQICDTCDGEGRAMCASLRYEAFTASDFEEDPDLYDALRQKRYHTTCEVCKGSGKVKVLDYDRIKTNYPTLYKRIEEQEREEEYSRREREWERRMGA